MGVDDTLSFLIIQISQSSKWQIFRHLDSSTPILLSEVLIKTEHHCSHSSVVCSQNHFHTQFFLLLHLPVYFTQNIQQLFTEKNLSQSDFSQHIFSRVISSQESLSLQPALTYTSSYKVINRVLKCESGLHQFNWTLLCSGNGVTHDVLNMLLNYIFKDSIVRMYPLKKHKMYANEEVTCLWKL